MSLWEAAVTIIQATLRCYITISSNNFVLSLIISFSSTHKTPFGKAVCIRCIRYIWPVTKDWKQKWCPMKRMQHNLYKPEETIEKSISVLQQDLIMVHQSSPRAIFVCLLVSNGLSSLPETVAFHFLNHPIHQSWSLHTENAFLDKCTVAWLLCMDA